MSYVLHDSLQSGNAWKVRLALSFLGLPYQRRTHILAEGTTRTLNYLAMNPMAKVPVLELPDGQCIRESNAILCHLARGTELMPQGIDETRALEWLFFEQSEALKPFASTRYWISIARKPEQKKDEILVWQAAGRKVLAVLESALRQRTFLVAERYSVADIALFPYISMAGEGGYDLESSPNVLAWIDRVRSHPSHRPLIEEAAPHAN